MTRFEICQSDAAYVIRHETELENSQPLYWSNEFGWVSGDIATIFTAIDKEDLNLPIGGNWERW